MHETIRSEYDEVTNVIAEQLNIDTSSPQFWIARACASTPLPLDWSASTDKEGRVVYLKSDGSSSQVHPLMHSFKPLQSRTVNDGENIVDAERALMDANAICEQSSFRLAQSFGNLARLSSASSNVKHRAKKYLRKHMNELGRCHLDMKRIRTNFDLERRTLSTFRSWLQKFVRDSDSLVQVTKQHYQLMNDGMNGKTTFGDYRDRALESMITEIDQRTLGKHLATRLLEETDTLLETINGAIADASSMLHGFEDQMKCVFQSYAEDRKEFQLESLPVAREFDAASVQTASQHFIVVRQEVIAACGRIQHFLQNAASILKLIHRESRVLLRKCLDIQNARSLELGKANRSLIAAASRSNKALKQIVKQRRHQGVMNQKYRSRLITSANRVQERSSAWKQLSDLILLEQLVVTDSIDSILESERVDICDLSRLLERTRIRVLKDRKLLKSAGSIDKTRLPMRQLL